MKRLLRVLFWIVVAASLLGNAVVLGLALRLGEMRETLNGGTGGFADLPRPIRAEFREVFAAHRADLAAPLANLGAARRAMFEAAAARPYDHAAVEAAMARVRDASAALQAKGQALLLLAFNRAAGVP
jgi:uncharacterized membrane protein